MATVDFTGSISVETDNEHTVEEMCAVMEQNVRDYLASAARTYDTTAVASLDVSTTL